MVVPGLCSVVIPSCNEGELLHRTVASVLREPCAHPIEVVVVDDASTDGSCDRLAGMPRVRVVPTAGVGAARARNAGAGAARGEYLTFLDAHCRVTPGWADGLIAPLAVPDVAFTAPSITRLDDDGLRGCGMVWTNWRLETAWIESPPGAGPYEMPFAPGGCQACRAETFARIGRFDDGMTRWGFEDIEISLRAWLLGYRVIGVPSVLVAHHFRDARGFEVTDLGVLFNFLRMIHLHFSPSRIEQITRALGPYPGLDEAMARLERSDVLAVRYELETVRPRTDAWFVTTFGPATPALAAA